jgi:hypothetical protein
MSRLVAFVIFIYFVYFNFIMADFKLKKRRIALIGLALGSFIVGSRILYLFKGLSSDTIIIDSIITGVGFVIAGISLLHLSKNFESKNK